MREEEARQADFKSRGKQVRSSASLTNSRLFPYLCQEDPHALSGLRNTCIAKIESFGVEPDDTCDIVVKTGGPHNGSQLSVLSVINRASIADLDKLQTIYAVMTRQMRNAGIID